MSEANKSVLILSYSNIKIDSRILRQIKWLEEAGFKVDVFGFGQKPDIHHGNFFEIPQLPLFKRVSIYLLASNKWRLEHLVTQNLNELISTKVAQGDYKFILANELEFIPWINSTQSLRQRNSNIKFILDLHEFYPGIKGSVIWRLINSRFQNWLLAQITSCQVDAYSVVAESIAEEYKKLGIHGPFSVVWNVPGFDSVKYAKRTSQRIQLVFHGNAGKGRPLGRYIFAMAKSKNKNLHLNLMLTSGKATIINLKILAKIMRCSDRISFIRKVSSEEVVKTISNFDVEIAWFPPSSQNMYLSLGNKFFEAIQGSLAVLIGPSPSMQELTVKFGFGLVVPNWKVRSLIHSLDNLTRDKVETLRVNSNKNAEKLSATFAKKIFLRDFT